MKEGEAKMGTLRKVVRVFYDLELTREDIEKQKERRARRNAFPKPTRDIEAFCRRLNTCPICGAYPHPLIVGGPGDYSIKMSCTGDPFHFDEGDWKSTFARAGKLWNEHTRDKALIKQERAKDAHLKTIRERFL